MDDEQRIFIFAIIRLLRIIAFFVFCIFLLLFIHFNAYVLLGQWIGYFAAFFFAVGSYLVSLKIVQFLLYCLGLYLIYRFFKVFWNGAQIQDREQANGAAKQKPDKPVTWSFIRGLVVVFVVLILIILFLAYLTAKH